LYFGWGKEGFVIFRECGAELDSFYIFNNKPKGCFSFQNIFMKNLKGNNLEFYVCYIYIYITTNIFSAIFWVYIFLGLFPLCLKDWATPPFL
jgi:hypothetical protein